MDLGPYLKSTPRNWFLPLMGPSLLEARPPPEEELPAIFREEDLSRRPLTMPENQEVEEDTEESDEADVEREFISFQKTIKLKLHNIKIFVIDSEDEKKEDLCFLFFLQVK